MMELKLKKIQDIGEQKSKKRIYSFQSKEAKYPSNVFEISLCMPFFKYIFRLSYRDKLVRTSIPSLRARSFLSS